jgi:hypothetical protein
VGIGFGGQRDQIKDLLRRKVRVRLCKLQKGCTRLAVASDKDYQLLAYGRWFSPGTPASSTTKTGRHDIDEILLKVALNTNNQSMNQIYI